MNRKEYMQLVEIALKDIPQSEKEEAIQYYNDYFDDAGEENEQQVISSLGSPAKLAESIIKEFSTGESRFESNRGNMGQNTTQNTYTENSPKKEKMSGWIIALIIFLTVLASPLLLALAATVFGVLVGVFGAIFGIVVAIFAVVLALGCVAVACIVAAISLGLISPFTAVALVGIGIATIGICIFLVMAIVWLFGVAIPGLIKGIGWVFKKIFSRKGGKQ